MQFNFDVTLKSEMCLTILHLLSERQNVRGLILSTYIHLATRLTKK